MALNRISLEFEFKLSQEQVLPKLQNIDQFQPKMDWPSCIICVGLEEIKT